MINLKKILCPVDLSELSMQALELAQTIAGTYEASLTITHVLENPYLDIPGGNTGAFSFGEIVGLYKEERQEEILDVLRRKGTPAVNPDIVFKEGVPYEQITSLAREIEADMVVMSNCTSGSHVALAGCTTERVVRLSPCPVLSVYTDYEETYRLENLMSGNAKSSRTILLPTDFSEHSELAADYAISFARRYEAELVVLHVMERVAEFTSMMGSDMPGYESVTTYYSEIQKTVERMIEEICAKAAKYNVIAHKRITSGNPRYDIVDIAKTEPIGLIVIGTHGRRGFSRVVHGSVAEAVVRHATCSVLSVKRPEHDFVTLE